MGQDFADQQTAANGTRITSTWEPMKEESSPLWEKMTASVVLSQIINLTCILYAYSSLPIQMLEQKTSSVLLMNVRVKMPTSFISTSSVARKVMIFRPKSM